jgi:hypothetical protein
VDFYQEPVDFRHSFSAAFFYIYENHRALPMKRTFISLLALSGLPLQAAVITSFEEASLPAAIPLACRVPRWGMWCLMR